MLDSIRCNAMVIDSADNIYLVGEGSSAIVLIKCNSSGSKLWERIWDSSRYDWVDDVCVDSQDNICIAGNYGYDMLVIKYNSSGEELWYRTWAQVTHQYGRAIDTDSNDSIYIGGVMDTYYPEFIERNLILLKYDSLGYLEWEEICKEGDGTVCYDMCIDSNNYIFLSGNLLEGDVQEYVYISIYDWQGNHLWNETWGDSIKSYGGGN
ncbi:hypothetical protein ES703_114915 [subsurface metagenome]